MLRVTSKKIFQRYPKLFNLGRVLLNRGYPIFLAYPVIPVSRYGYGKSAHKKLYDIISENRESFADTLRTFLQYKDYLASIPKEKSSTQPQEPYWNNNWFSGLDAIALYGLLVSSNPKRYVEVGSGNSTKFARRAIRDHDLQTHITSIDPNPRGKIDDLCDKVIRVPLENVDLEVFEELASGDVLFIDSSHQVFMNSDVAVFFLDILPRLKRGVLVHIHDVFLPLDYPPSWGTRYYSEQYLLAIYLLGAGGNVEIVLPNAFVSNDESLNHLLEPLFSNPRMENISISAGSFWITTG